MGLFKEGVLILLLSKQFCSKGRIIPWYLHSCTAKTAALKSSPMVSICSFVVFILGERFNANTHGAEFFFNTAVFGVRVQPLTQGI